jgi:hypothetical protein
LLPNGQILVVGGNTGSVLLASAELYDLASGTWLPTGSLSLARRLHTATLLPDGKVLVVGGLGSDNLPISLTELYNAVSGTWSSAGSLPVAFEGHTATLLPGGQVLIAGGYNNGSALATTFLYEPATGIWKTNAPLNVARGHHTATLLPNGKVLVVAGQGNFTPYYLSSCELYDPLAGTWTITGALVTGRRNHSATLLLNGKVLVAGGANSTSPPWLGSVEVYDPATGQWTSGGSLTTARTYHTANLLPNGKVLVAGGTGAGGNAELHDPNQSFSASWQPQIDPYSAPLSLGDILELTGSKFRGVSEGASGQYQDSPSDYPLLQLRSVETGQTSFLVSTQWSSTSFTSVPVWGLPPGYTMMTIFANGIPSTSQIINISVPTPTTPFLMSALTTNGVFQVGFTNSPGALFAELMTTNLNLPLSNWTVLGKVTEPSPGQFQFVEPSATKAIPRFYRVRSP